MRLFKLDGQLTLKDGSCEIRLDIVEALARCIGLVLFQDSYL